jgi:hypothetical protein
MLIVGILFFISTASNATLKSAMTIKNRPEGWDGIFGGDSPLKFGHNKLFVSEDVKHGAMYVIPNQTTRLGDANINKITYYFNANKLIAIDFLCAKTEEIKLFSYAVAEFGSPQLIGINTDKFVWFDDVVCIYMKFAANQGDEHAFMRYLLKKYANNNNFPKFPLKKIRNIGLLMGFGGIKLGDSLEILGQDTILVRSNQRLGTLTYKKIIDKTEFNGFEIEEIGYSFLQSRLFFIEISFKKSVSKKQFIQYMTQLLGKPACISFDEKFYQWYDNSDVAIFIDENSNGIRLTYGFIDLLNSKK